MSLLEKFRDAMSPTTPAQDKPPTAKERARAQVRFDTVRSLPKRSKLRKDHPDYGLTLDELVKDEQSRAFAHNRASRRRAGQRGRHATNWHRVARSMQMQQHRERKMRLAPEREARRERVQARLAAKREQLGLTDV